MESLTFPRDPDDNLSFRGQPLLTGRHRIHPYPAMLHPLLVDHLIEKFLPNPRSSIFDPFCGSGVTLLQGALRENNVIGVDINPLAMLISKVKTSSYDEVTLCNELKDLSNSIAKCQKTDIPPLRNVETWYHPKVVSDLGRIRYVLKSKDYRYRDFFITCLAYVCRQQSYTRHGEFKRHRVPETKRKNTKSEVIPLFLTHAETMCEVYIQQRIPITSIRLARQSVDTDIPFDFKVDMVLTSPPYGDSSTTVAYEQYTSFGFEWTNDLTAEFVTKSEYYKLSLGYKRNSSSAGTILKD